MNKQIDNKCLLKPCSGPLEEIQFKRLHLELLFFDITQFCSPDSMHGSSHFIFCHLNVF